MKRLIYKLNNESNYEELTCGNSSSHNALRLISFIAPFGIQCKLDGTFSVEKDRTFFFYKETGLVILELRTAENSFFSLSEDGDSYHLRLTPKNISSLRRQCTKNNKNKAPFLIITKKKPNILIVIFQQKLTTIDLECTERDKTMASIIFGLRCAFWICFIGILVAAYCTKPLTTA